MDFAQEVFDFVTDKIGGVTIVAEGSSEIVFADDFFTNKYGSDLVGQDADEVYRWQGDCPELELNNKAIEWETIDTDTKSYYRFESAVFEKDIKRYRIHRVVDITEYMGLNRDVTKYMSFFKKLSGFQAAVLEKLSDTYYALMPMVADYFKTGKVYFYLQNEDNIDIISYSKLGDKYITERVPANTAAMQVFGVNSEDEILFSSYSDRIQQALKNTGSTEESKYRLLCSGEVSNQKYSMQLSTLPNLDVDSLRETTLVSVIRLYLENGIMRDKLIYENEHDKLTGLYNKAKYIEMSESKYLNLNSIAVFNFDVNNLKKVNDTLGHEMGDKLIIKAADSIRAVTSHKIHGYRMGGDEFLMVAVNIREDDFIDIKTRWENELVRLNSMDDLNCVVALGAVYAKDGYDFGELVKEADNLMYEDKKNKKKPGEEVR